LTIVSGYQDQVLHPVIWIKGWVKKAVITVTRTRV
jgi:hypothetical protein